MYELALPLRFSPELLVFRRYFLDILNLGMYMSIYYIFLFQCVYLSSAFAEFSTGGSYKMKLLQKTMIDP